MGMIQKFLGDIFNLFPLGGSTGGIVVRQKGGVAGTDQIEIYEDGSAGYLVEKNGTWNLDGTVVIRRQDVTSRTITITPDVAGSWAQIVASQNGIRIGSPIQMDQQILGFSNGSGNTHVALDRAGSFAVLKVTDGSSGNGWLQNSAGRSRVTTTDVTNTSTTFAAITGLTATLIAGRKYSGWVALKVNSATAADGMKFDFNGGTATMTNFWAAMYPIAGAPATKGVDLSTALNTALTFTALGDTNDAVVLFSVNLVCNAAGTFIPEFALNSGSGTATVRISSAMWLDDMP